MKILKAPTASTTRIPKAYPKSWAGSQGRDRASTGDLPKIPNSARQKPEFLVILSIPDVSKSDPVQWLVARLIRAWLYGGFGSRRVQDAPLADRERRPRCQTNENVVKQLVLEQHIFGNNSQMFSGAYQRAKDSGEQAVSGLTLERLYEKSTEINKGWIGSTYLSARTELDKTPEQIVTRHIGDFNYKHNPALYLGSEIVSSGDYLDPSNSGDLSTHASLAEFPINYYGRFELKLWKDSSSGSPIEMMQIECDSAAVRLSDNFDFENSVLAVGDIELTSAFDQPLGVWASAPSASLSIGRVQPTSLGGSLEDIITFASLKLLGYSATRLLGAWTFGARRVKK